MASTRFIECDDGWINLDMVATAATRTVTNKEHGTRRVLEFLALDYSRGPLGVITLDDRCTEHDVMRMLGALEIDQ